MIKRIALLFLLLGLLVSVGAAAAQDVIIMEYGDVHEGEIEDPEQGVLYAFYGTSGDEIVITAESDEIDVYLRFGTEDGILAQNDNISRRNTNAEISYRLDETRIYYFAVLGYDEGEYEVSLSVTSQNTSNTRREVSNQIPRLEYGDTVEGETIDLETPVVYTFSGEEGDVVTIIAESDDIEPYIVVVDFEGELVDRDYEEITIELPADGDYLVGVFGEEDGEYELTIELENDRAVSNNDEPLELIFEGTVDDDEPFSQFVLEDVPAGAVITIDVQTISGDLDAYVGLIFDGEVVAENDDRERGDTNPLLEYRAEEAGDYIVVVTRYGFEDGDTEGDYEAIVEIGAASKVKVLNEAFGIAPTGVRFLSEDKPQVFEWTALGVARSEEAVLPLSLWSSVGDE